MKKVLKVVLLVILAVGVATTLTVKDVQTNKDGIQITFRDNSGYWIEY